MLAQSVIFEEIAVRLTDEKIDGLTVSSPLSGEPRGLAYLLAVRQK
jgi:hypothetical protein